MEERIRALRPHVIEWNDYRGAKPVAINGGTATIRVRLATGHIRNRTVATAALPTPAVGSPIAVRISSGNPDTFTVLEIVGSHWPPGDAPSDEAGDIANDGRWPVVPRSVTGESEEFSWTQV